MNIITETWDEFSNDDCGTLAAALAYYTVFSLPAMLLIVVKVAGAVLGESAVKGQLQDQLASSMGPQVANQISIMISNASKSTTGGSVALALGILGLLWSASNVSSQLQTALNRAWSVRAREEGTTGLIRKRLLSFLLIVGIGLLVILALSAGAAAGAFGGSLGVPLWGVLVRAGEAILSFVIFMFLFGAVYKVLPDARIDWQDVRAGAMITALLFAIGKFLIGIYL